jgi:CBS domain containing-hemolysin-like protein
LDCRPLVSVLVGLLFRADDLVFVARSITGERVSFGDVNSDDASSKELLRLRPLYWFAKILAPAIWVGDSVAKATLGLFGIQMTQSWTETEQEVIESRADLRNRLGSVLEDGNVASDRREEVMNALDIGEQPVREVMVPAEDIVTLSTAVGSEENFRRMEANPHTRYPLIGDQLTDFEGIVYFPILARHREELATGDVDFAKLAAPPMTLSPDVDVSDAIDQFQAENQELALIIEDGEVVGMVTVTDLLESVMGDIEDPIDIEYIASDESN